LTRISRRTSVREHTCASACALRLPALVRLAEDDSDDDFDEEEDDDEDFKPAKSKKTKK